MEIIRGKINTYFGHNSWQFYKITEAFGDRYYLIGEFFGESKYDFTLDLAVLVKDYTNAIKLLMYEAYNYNHAYDGISLIDLKDDCS
jgi:hypothetical protein